MTGKATSKRELVRYDSLDDMPPAGSFSEDIGALTDAAIEARAASDPDAGPIPADFWDGAALVRSQTNDVVTLRLDSDVLRFFRGEDQNYQARMADVLKSYVRERRKAG